MTRLARSRLDALLGAMLAIVFVALGALWIRTTFVEDVFRLQNARRYFYVNSLVGGVQFGTFPKSEYDPKLGLYESFTPAQFNNVWQMYVKSARHSIRFAGFWYLSDVPWIRSYWTLCVPIWFLMLITSAGAAALFGHRRQLVRRQMAGLCRNCGYDLRASPDRCPECGSEVREEIK